MKAAASSFKASGGGGFLRNVDGTITGLEFTTNQPGAGSKPKPGVKKSDFQGVYAQLTIQQDGVDEPRTQSLLVGGQTDFDGEELFSVSESGTGVSGPEDAQIPANLPWGIFYASLVNPKNGEGFDESVLDDSDPTVAEYAPIIGARVRFGWQVNPELTKKKGPRVAMKDGKPVKGKDGKPLTYDREDLIVTAYYGQADEAPAAPTAKATKSAPAAKATKAAKAPAVDIAELATERILTLLADAKDHSMSKVRLNSKLLLALNDVAAGVRDEVRAWANDADNLGGLDGVTFDAKAGTLTLDE